MSGLRQRLVSLMLLIVVAISGATVGVDAQGTPQATVDAITIIGAAESPMTLTVSEIQALPNESLDVTYTASGESEDHTFTGTPLLGVLEAVGLPFAEDVRNPWLGTIVLVTANDGYQVVFGGGELDPAFGNVPIYLTWEQDGAPLSAEDSPLRIVVPGDTKGGRYVSGVETIEIISVGDLDHDHN